MKLPAKRRMNAAGFLVLLLALLLPAATGGIELKAIITYTNDTDQPAKNIVHRLTIPPDTSYQKVSKISTINIDSYKIRDHKNKIDRYLQFEVEVAPSSSTTGQVIFTVEKLPLSYSAGDIKPLAVRGELKQFLRPSKNIESDAEEIQALARKIAESDLPLGEQIKSAYALPDKLLQYKPQKATSALTALQTGVGDCTEYSYIFVGISRNLGIPARVISGFFFEKKHAFTRPNHHESEIFTEKYGWVPVFPNLGNSKYEDRYGFGKNPDTFITLMRSSVWTWSNSFPMRMKASTKKVKAKVSWEVNTNAPELIPKDY